MIYCQSELCRWTYSSDVPKDVICALLEVSPNHIMAHL